MSPSAKIPIYASPVAEGARFSVGSTTAFAVRREEKDIALRIRREKRPLKRSLQRVPFVRGIQRLFQATWGLLDGYNESYELYPQRISKGNGFEQGFSSLFQLESESFVGFLSGFVMVALFLGFVLGLPLAVETWVLPNVALTRGAVNALMCVIRILGLWLCTGLCMRLRITRRVCMYRGAINKVLNAWEARHSAPELQEVMEASRLYRRSDGAFLMVVLSLSIVSFALIRTFTLPVQLLVRILTILVVAAVINEPIRALERGHKNPLSSLYRTLSRMFVLEPHEQMVEVALCAFNAARENDRT